MTDKVEQDNKKALSADQVNDALAALFENRPGRRLPTDPKKKKTK
ncbi:MULTISPECIES: hypothetical protein [Loigolactobacillus]|nr:MULTISPECIES: hypothetical protein [Loigolactobacillus]MDA5388672.1 hypothetical protein [Loigolactobacillus backii]MDA5391144.1 hypothetical protein [Loigolactobacillus backii]